MSIRINTNTTSINAHNNLLNTSDALSRSIERLSSGLRINRSADDPAGLVISENLRAQISGVTQAMANANDAVNLVKTAEGALSEVHSLLRTMRSLALHAANTGINDLTAVQADQTQINSAIESINRIAQQTQFGTKRLLDGTSGIAAAVTRSDYVAGMFVGGRIGDGSVITPSGAVELTVGTAAERATFVGTVATFADANELVGASGTIVINGASIQVSENESVQNVINKINDLTSATGVRASFNADHVELTTTQYGSQFSITASESTAILGFDGSTETGVDAAATVVYDKGGANETSVAFTGGVAAGESGLKLRDASGNIILLTENGNLNASADQIGTVTVGSLSFAVGANADQTVALSLGNVQASQLGTTVVASVTLASVDVTTATGANNALKVIDEAISQISTLRANLGSFQKQSLESTMRSLGVTKENLAASESAIRDTDMAAEMVSFTRSQILMQAGTAMLAQANAMPQQVLQLLRG
jgi:flagellin